MSDLRAASGAHGADPVPNPSVSGTGELKGSMGTVALILSVLAVAAPLASVNGLFPLVIGFSGDSAPIAYIIATAALLALAVALATMSRHVFNPGAFYAYVTAGLGRRLGLGGAFLAILAYWLMTTASFAYLGSAVNRLLVQFGGPDIAWYWWQMAGWLLVAVLGYLNVELSAKVLTVIMVLEVLIVIVFDVAVVARGGADGLELPRVDTGVFTSGNIGIAVLFSVLSFIGFESTAIYREEARNPERTVPRAMFLSVLLIGIFYAVSVTIMLMAYGSSASVVATDNPAGMFTDALRTFAGPIFMDVCTVLLVTSVLASLIALQNMLSRYLYSLGKDGVLPASLGVAHPVHRSPHRASIAATLMTGALGLPFVFNNDEPMVFYGKMIGVGTYAIVVLMLLASVAVFVFFRRNRQCRGSVWRTTVAPLVAVAGFAGVLYLATIHIDLITGLSGAAATATVVLAYAITALGFVLAWVLRAHRPQVFARIGRQDV